MLLKSRGHILVTLSSHSKKLHSKLRFVEKHQKTTFLVISVYVENKHGSLCK